MNREYSRRVEIFRRELKNKRAHHPGWAYIVAFPYTSENRKLYFDFINNKWSVHFNAKRCLVRFHNKEDSLVRQKEVIQIEDTHAVRIVSDAVAYPYFA